MRNKKIKFDNKKIAASVFLFSIIATIIFSYSDSIGNFFNSTPDNPCGTYVAYQEWGPYSTAIFDSNKQFIYGSESGPNSFVAPTVSIISFQDNPLKLIQDMNDRVIPSDITVEYFTPTGIVTSTFSSANGDRTYYCPFNLPKSPPFTYAARITFNYWQYANVFDHTQPKQKFTYTWILLDTQTKLVTQPIGNTYNTLFETYVGPGCLDTSKGVCKPPFDCLILGKNCPVGIRCINHGQCGQDLVDDCRKGYRCSSDGYNCTRDYSCT